MGPGTPADQVCANAFEIVQVGLGDQLQTTPGSGVSPGLAARILRTIDFDVLAQAAPPRLRRDVKVLRKGAPELLAGIERAPGEAPAPEANPRLLAAAGAVTSWISERCR